MEEQQAPAPVTTEGAVRPASEHREHHPETLAELAQTPLPAPAASPGVKSGPSTKKPTPQRLLEQAGSQVDALRQAETIKQLQKQVTLLEGQSRDTGKVFVATTAALISSAFALVAALAWNEAIQALFKQVFPPSTDGKSGWPLVASTFGYALVITIVVVVVIFQLSRLTTKFGGRSLIGGGGGGGKEG